MANISHLIKGQSDWQEPINQLIDLTNGGVGKPLSIKRFNDAITFTGGFHQMANQGHPFLKVLSLDDGTNLCELFITGWGTWLQGENELGYIPSNYAPDNARFIPMNLHWDNSNTTYLTLGADGKLTIWCNYDNKSDTNAQIGGTSVVYFAMQKN